MKQVKNAEASKKSKHRLKKKTIKRLIRLVVLIVILVVGFIVIKNRFLKKDETKEVITTAIADRRDIENVLTSSGTIEPLAEYDIATLVKGEIIAADFEIGDTVEEGSVLYQLTTDDVETQIDTAKTGLERAEKSYEKAVASKSKTESKYEDTVKKYKEAQEKYADALADYNEAVAKYNEKAAEYDDLNIKSSYKGTISNVYAQEGDNINAGAKIAEIYDDSTMILSVPFNADQVDDSIMGKTASIEITEGFEQYKGKVTSIEDKKSVLSGNQIVRMVSITVNNPGGISTTTKATASVDKLYCASEGTFTVGLDETITADKAGTIGILSIKSGDMISKGDSIAMIDNDSVETQLTNYQKEVDAAKTTLSNMESSEENAKNAVADAKDAIQNAQDSIEDCEDAIEDAQSTLDDQTDALTDCYINAPVTGKVISKNMLVGDVIGTNNFNNTLAVIYDLSAVKFDMYVDELDIGTVEIGQEVKVTADALTGVTITGKVTNISLISSSSGGVTQYPITVQIDEVGNLLPGMNVTGEIIIQEVEDVVAVPAEAIQRGNQVYVKDDTVTEAEGMIPAGFRAVEVETGLSDGDYIQIVSGLEEGTEIYTARIKSGSANGMFGMEGFSFGTGDMPSGGFPGGSSGSKGGYGGQSSGSRPRGSFSGGGSR